MDIALTLVSLGDKQVRYMSANVIFITDGITAENLLKTKRPLASSLREKELLLLTFSLR